MVESAPTSIDLQDFQFKLHSKCRIFDSTDDSKFNNSCSLLTAASRYGLIFIGTADASFEVIQLNTLQNIEHTNIKTESNCAKRSIPLSSNATHLALNCDSTFLSVVCNKNDCTTVIIYNVPSFLSQNVSIVREIRLSATPGVNVLETNWNPAIPTIFTACKADGSLGVYNIQETSVDINELPVAAGARCFCWSPKGKQLVVGGANGSLTQYKPDLKAVKVIQAPPLTGKGPFFVINLFWLTNYQFLATYKDAGDVDARPWILIVNAPKTGNIIYINYEDICYSYGNLRPAQYYIIHQPIWGVLLVASANGNEVGVLGISHPGEPALWQQWNQIDAARAELPLSANQQETFPVGFAFDTGVTMQLPWGENQTLPSMPMIHVLSHHGVLCSFSVINLMQGAANLCSSPEPIMDQSGLNQFIVKQMNPPSISSSSAMLKPEISASPMALAEPAMPVSTISTELPKPADQLSLFETPKSISGFITAINPPETEQSSLFSGSNQFLHGTSPATPIPNFQNPSASSINATKDQFFFQNPNTLNAENVSSLANDSLSSGNTGGTSSMFGVLGISNFNTSSSKPTMFGITMPTTSSLSSLTSKTVIPSNTLSFSSTPLNSSTSNSQAQFQNNTLFNIASKPISQPLLATPKETLHTNVIQKPIAMTKSDRIESKSDSTIQLSNSQTNSSDSFAIAKDEEIIIKNRMIQTLINEEVKNFHIELQELFFRCKNINLNVGTEDEKNNLVIKTESLLDFYCELKDTTDSQVSEVYYLKQALMQSFAWYEDTKARHKRYTDPNFASLLQMQELDPVSEKQMADIKHLIYYIEAQLRQIDGFLDNQWADFQDSCKKHIKGKLHIPTLEPIYQSLVRQNAILDRLKYVLKDIGARIKSRNKKAANYPHVMNKINRNTHKEIQLYEEFHNLMIETDIFHSRYEKIIANENKYTETKNTKLCEFFSNRNVTHIAPRKPKFVSNIFQISPSKFNSSYASSPGVNRSLRSTFDSIAQQSTFDTTMNTSVEANLSSSNIFSFNLLEGGHSTKFRTPEKEPLTKTKADLLFNTPTSNENQKVINPFPKILASSNLPTNGSTLTATPIFSFTASSTAITQSKQHNMTSSMGNMFTPASNFTFDQSKFAAAIPDNAKSSTFFSFSSPNSSIVTPLENKTFETIISGSSKSTEAKSNVVKSTSEPTSCLSDMTIGDSKLIQSFSSIAQQSKPTIIPKASLPKNMFKGAGDTTIPTRDSLDTGFSFRNLDLGQHSTPTPKSTITATSNIVQPATTESVLKSAPLSDPVMKSSFSFIQPSATISQTPVDGSLPQHLLLPGVTITPINKSEVNTVTPITASIFGGLSANLPTTVNSFFGQSTIVSTTPNNFGFSQSGSSIFGSSFSIEPASSVTNSTTAIVSITPTLSSAQPIGTATTAGSVLATSSAHMSGIVPFSVSTSTVGTASTASTIPAASAALTANSTLIVSTTSAVINTLSITASSETPIITTFSVTQLTSTITSTAPVKTTSLFGGTGPVTSTVPSVFASTPSTASTFSFLQPAVTTTGTPSVFGKADTSKSGSIFGVQSTASVITKADSVFGTAPTNTSSSGFAALPTSTTTTESGFGFPSQTTTSESTFSFGQLTVAALSPNVTTTTPVVTSITTNASSFSFVLPAAATAATMTTTTTSSSSNANVFGGFGSPSAFGKPATTTTASSFMGQPICSPGAFSQSQQSTGSIFGQATGNVFAQKSSTGGSGSSIFGQPSGSLFGQSATNTTVATTASSIFGQTQSSPFGSPAQSTTASGGSIFGQTSGFTNTAATTASSIFGQNSYGSPAATSGSGSFSFTQNAGNTGFGNSGGSIFGNKSSFGATSAFGQPPAFGSPSTFGATPTTGVFGSPVQANNSGSFGAGFGSPSSGFVQKSAFGSPPSFGQTAFGSPPTFGSTSTFGSPNRVFGAGAAPVSGNFSPTVQENSTFANLANQSTLGFGSLAQNQAPVAPQPQAPQFSGGAQFSSWR